MNEIEEIQRMGQEFDGGMARPADQALAVPAKPASGLGAPRCDPSREIVLGFTGSQHLGTRLQREALKRALCEFRDRGALWMHNGDCIEADAYAGTFWRAIGGKVHLHPPTDTRRRAFIDCDATSPAKDFIPRNRDIVNAATHLVAMPLEFSEQPRGGTWSTVRYARLRGTPTMIIRPNGSFVSENWPASGIEAATADETGTGSAVGESAVVKPDAQVQST